MKTTFEYSWLVKFLTIVAILITLLVAVLAVQHLLTLRGSERLTRWLLGGMLFVITVVNIATLGSMPLHYVHNEDGVKVRLLAYSLNYPAADYDIRECSMKLDRSVRVCASGGFGGYLGLFRYKGKNCIFMLTNEREEVIEMVNKRTGRHTYISK